MRAFTEPLTQLQGYEELEQAVQKTEGVILVSGCIDAVKLSGERYSFLSVGYPWKCSDIRTYQCPENDG